MFASSKTTPDTQLKKDQAHIEAIYNRECSINFYESREKLGKLFYDHVGIVRDNDRLKAALEEVTTMQVALPKMGIADPAKTHNQNLIEFLEFSNALLLAPTVISSATARDESRGAHFKRGFESENNERFKKHIVLQWNNKGGN